MHYACTRRQAPGRSTDGLDPNVRLLFESDESASIVNVATSRGSPTAATRGLAEQTITRMDLERGLAPSDFVTATIAGFLL